LSPDPDPDENEKSDPEKSPDPQHRFHGKTFMFPAEVCSDLLVEAVDHVCDVSAQLLKDPVAAGQPGHLLL